MSSPLITARPLLSRAAQSEVAAHTAQRNPHRTTASDIGFSPYPDAGIPPGAQSLQGALSGYVCVDAWMRGAQALPFAQAVPAALAYAYTTGAPGLIFEPRTHTLPAGTDIDLNPAHAAGKAFIAPFGRCRIEQPSYGYGIFRLNGADDVTFRGFDFFNGTGTTPAAKFVLGSNTTYRHDNYSRAMALRFIDCDRVTVEDCSASGFYACIGVFTPKAQKNTAYVNRGTVLRDLYLTACDFGALANGQEDILFERVNGGSISSVEGKPPHLIYVSGHGDTPAIRRRGVRLVNCHCRGNSYGSAFKVRNTWGAVMIGCVSVGCAKLFTGSENDYLTMTHCHAHDTVASLFGTVVEGDDEDSGGVEDAQAGVAIGFQTSTYCEVIGCSVDVPSPIEGSGVLWKDSTRCIVRGGTYATYVPASPTVSCAPMRVKGTSTGIVFDRVATIQTGPGTTEPAYQIGEGSGAAVLIPIASKTGGVVVKVEVGATGTRVRFDMDLLTVSGATVANVLSDVGTGTKKSFVDPPGPYADDSAAATAGVYLNEPYRKSGGTLAWRVA